MSATGATGGRVIRRDMVEDAMVEDARTPAGASEAEPWPEALLGMLDGGVLDGVLDIWDTGAPLSSKVRRGAPS